MKKIVLTTAMSLWIVALAVAASADTLILRDGTRLEGTVVSIAGRTITFRDADGVSRRYAATFVESLRFDGGEPVTTTRTSNRQRLVVPAGTALVVRTVEAIDSKDADVDQTFSALFEQDVVDASGRVIIPVRSSAQLIIRQLSSGGATGSPEIVLDVESLTVNGRRYLVSTTDLSQDSNTGIGKNKRTAEAVGGGAALGGLIGAIVGGGKGAAIGVIAGGAGGAGVQVLTRGHDVRVPAETILKFSLDKPVTLQPDRE